MRHSGGDSVALGIVPSSPTFWDLGPRQYLFGDNSALKTFNQTCQRIALLKGATTEEQ